MKIAMVSAVAVLTFCVVATVSAQGGATDKSKPAVRPEIIVVRSNSANPPNRGQQNSFLNNMLISDALDVPYFVDPMSYILSKKLDFNYFPIAAGAGANNQNLLNTMVVHGLMN